MNAAFSLNRLAEQLTANQPLTIFYRILCTFLVRHCTEIPTLNATCMLACDMLRVVLILALNWRNMASWRWTYESFRPMVWICNFTPLYLIVTFIFYTHLIQLRVLGAELIPVVIGWEAGLYPGQVSRQSYTETNETSNQPHSHLLHS